LHSWGGHFEDVEGVLEVPVVAFEAVVAEANAQSLFSGCLSCPLVDAGWDVALGADPSGAT
jgi:hypothetical protein